MAYTYEQVFAADPANPANIAQNAAVTIFAPGDATMTPLSITDPDGTPLPNPIPVNANGFGSAFAHATLDRVAWAGGGFTGFFTSYEGMKQVALDAQAAAEAAAATAGAEAAAVADAAIGDATADAAAAQAAAEAAAVSAANAAATASAPADTAIAAAVNNNASATKAALNATYATPRRAQAVAASGRGALCLHFDDGTPDHYTIAAPIVEAAGGRATFPIHSNNTTFTAGSAGSMSHAQIADLVARGHEVAAHSKTHTDMTTQTAAARVAEWDDSKTVLQGITGKPVTSFVYPYSAHNAATNKEAYCRYDRTFSGVDTPFFTTRPQRGKSIRTGRYAWTDAAHVRVTQFVARAAATDSVLTLIAHKVNGTDLAQGITQAQLQEVVDLAVSLGMPIITAKDAFPAYLGAPSGGFEDSNYIGDWEKFNTSATNTITAVQIAPAVGLPGTGAVEIVGDGTNYPYLASRYGIPILEAGEHTASVQMRLNKTSGTGGAYIGVREYDSSGVQVGTDINSAIVSTTGLTDWQTIKIAFTPNAKTVTAKVLIAQTPMVGSAWFDHLNFGPTKYGVLN
jgi:peptidoglycan/xylan/chitin deacetylase (PgdA/CDA1 family)